MTTSSQVSKLYHTVVEDVINNVKEAFLDEGVDEQVLQELKQLWESKLAASKALEPPPIDTEVHLAPSAVAMRMPQPLHSKNTSALEGAAAQAGQTQQVPGAVAQVGQPTQTAIRYQPSEAAQSAAMALPAGIFRQHLPIVGAGGQIQNITVQQTGTGQYITLPQFQAQQQTQPIAIQPQQPQAAQHVRIPIQPQQQQFLQHQHQQQQQAQLFHAGQLLQHQAAGKGQQGLSQLDGNEDTSSSEDDEDFDVDDKDDEEKEEENEEEQREEEDPLNSADDVSEEDPTDLFDTENVVVCQYDKINRNKNKWKFHLKDGIMNLNGRDFVFQKATGDSEW